MINHSYLEKESIRLGNVLSYISVTLLGLWHWLREICFSARYRHSRYIFLVMRSTWLDFWEILFATSVVLANFYFLFSISDVPIKVKHYWPYLRNGWSDWRETKRKCIGWILVDYVTLTFAVTLHLDLGFFRVKFPNACISGLINVKQKWHIK